MPRRRPAPGDEPHPDDRAGAPAPGSARADPAAGWAPRDMLIPYVLLAVSLQRAHGYLIQESLKNVGFFGVELSTLYRTLRQLEKEGLLLSSWEPGPTGPARRVYSLTDAGAAWLQSWSFALEAYRAMIDRFFGLYTPVGVGGAPAEAAPAPDTEPDTEEPPR